MAIIINCRSDSEDRFQLYLDKTFNKTVKIMAIVVLITSVIMMTVMDGDDDSTWGTNFDNKMVVMIKILMMI